MTDIYCFDTNVFINLTSRYPQQIFTTLWQRLDDLCGNKRIVVPEMVVRENKHELTDKWISERDLVVPIDGPQQHCLKRILAQLPNFVDHSKTEDEADQFVVALAMASNEEYNRNGSQHQMVVVTEEKPKKGAIPKRCESRCLRRSSAQADSSRPEATWLQHLFNPLVPESAE